MKKRKIDTILPADIWAIIMNQLDLSSILALSLVNQQFYAISRLSCAVAKGRWVIDMNNFQTIARCSWYPHIRRVWVDNVAILMALTSLSPALPLTDIRLRCSTAIPARLFPETTRRLYISNPHFNQPLGPDFLPPHLQSLRIDGYNFNQPLDQLPETLTCLKLQYCTQFNQPLDRLPQQLRYCSVGAHFDQPIDKLPGSLTIFKISILNQVFNRNCGNLPLALEKLRIPASHTILHGEFEQLPSTLRYLECNPNTAGCDFSEFHNLQHLSIVGEGDSEMMNIRKRKLETLIVNEQVFSFID